MKKIDELQQLRGVGPVVAQGLRDAGLDSFGRIAQEGEGALRAIRGIRQEAVPGIVQQAALLAGAEGEELAGKGGSPAQDGGGEELSGKVEAVRESLQSLAKHARERFAGKVPAKAGRRLSENLVRIADSLAVIAQSGKHPKRSQKGLLKVERRMEALEGVGLKKFSKGLKKSRKILTELAR